MKTIKWLKKRDCHFTGRNGWFKCCGIEIMNIEHNKSIIISPITSKGSIGRCNIEIPADPDILYELIRTIQKSLDETKE